MALVAGQERGTGRKGGQGPNRQAVKTRQALFPLYKITYNASLLFRPLARAASRFSCLGGRVIALLEPITRPPLPAFRHSRNRKQPRDFRAISRVDAKD